jgi:hypothetical protein
MGIFGNIFKVVTDIVEVPIAAAKDIVTMGGVLDEKGSYTAQKLKELKDDLIHIDEVKKPKDE